MNVLQKLFRKQKEEVEVNMEASEDGDGDSPDEMALRKKTMEAYSKVKAINEISLFEKEMKALIQSHLAQTDYKTHKVLLREVESLVHYTIEVLKDDYLSGHKFFNKNQTRMTRLDDYVFSQFGKDDKLSVNIKKLKMIAFSNRFDENPRQNLLSYFVFLEETGLEIIILFNDFYSMLDKSQSKSRWSFSYKSIFKFNKELYQKRSNDIDSPGDSSVTSSNLLKTMMTDKIDMSPRTVQKELIQDKIRREGEQNK